MPLSKSALPLKGDIGICREHCQSSKRNAVMKFVSLLTKEARRSNRLAKSTTAAPLLTKSHTYAELRQQIHDDLRLQHPEWIQPDGESPICDSYEARLMELLEHSTPRLA